MSKQPYRGDGALTQTDTHVLDCPDCGEWFSDFDKLARHRYARHGPPVPYGTLPEDRQTPMAKRKTTTRKTTEPRKAGSAIPEPQANETGDFNPFLKPDDLGDVGAEAILMFTGDVRFGTSQYGEQIICEVRYNRTVYDYAIKLNTPSHRLLFERFGKNPKKWVGKVAVSVKENLNRPYIAVQRGQ